MVKEIKEVREVTEVKEKVIGFVKTCDVCGKVIYDTREDVPMLGAHGQHWWELTTGHCDWGNDSIDSIEDFDLCSPDCLRHKLEEYIKDSNHEINSCYFNVEHERR